MLIRIKAFLISVSIAMGLVAIHTSVTNLLWLSSIDMPISLGIIISTIASDIIGMSFQGEVPVIALILIGLLIAFCTAGRLFKSTTLSEPKLYALAGGTALLATVMLLSLALGSMDLIAGARTSLGRCIIILAGILAGYYFGVQLTKVANNED